MAAPVTVVRGTPAGYKMPDGYQTEITFQLFPTLAIWEVSAKPPGIDIGEPIPTSTMLNAFWNTTSPRHLRTLTPLTFQCAYDPDVLLTMYSLVGREQSISQLFPEGSNQAFYGFLQKFDPEDLKAGQFPMASCTIVPTNWDPINFVEAGPVFTAGPL